jgi:hypothetical protein
MPAKRTTPPPAPGPCEQCASRAATGRHRGLCRSCWDVASGQRARERAVCAARRDNGLCPKCGDPPEDGRINCRRCLDVFRAHRGPYTERLRGLVYEHYGNRCVCCGETERCFLSIDHINGHPLTWQERRKHTGGGYGPYAKIIRAGFPEDIRILCHNCNHGRELNGGVCPHGNGV